MSWLYLFVVFALLAIHPFLTYPLSLLAIRKARYRAPARAQAMPTISIVCCAYNEAPVIERKLRNLLAIRRRWPGVQVLVYSDGSSDGTAEVIRRHAGEIECVVSARRQGKSVGMNTLLAKATGDIVVFTDANVELDVEAFGNLARHFSDPKIGCVCGHLRYINAGESQAAAAGSLYWRFEEALKRLETDTGSVMGADGSLFAIRRKLFRKAPPDIIDDMHTSLSILCDGYRVVQADDVVALERSVSSTSEEFRRKVRISCRAFNCHRLMWPRLSTLSALDLYKYVSHKFLRWVSIYLQAASLLCLLAWFALRGQGGQALLAMLAAAGLAWALSQLPPFAAMRKGWEFATAFVATGMGVWKSLAGERYQTWATAATARK